MNGDKYVVVEFDDDDGQIDPATLAKIKIAMERPIPPDEMWDRIQIARAAYAALGATPEQLDESYPLPQ